MKDEILNHISDPDQLETLYRHDKSAFVDAFMLLYPQIQEEPLARFWKARLVPQIKPAAAIFSPELLWILVLGILVIFFTKLPDLFALDPEYFYPRHLSFILFLPLGIYLAAKHRFPTGKWIFMGLSVGLGLIYINRLPGSNESDLLILVCMHLPVLLWALTGYAYMGGKEKDRIAYLKFSGDWIIMTGLLLLTGILLSGITIGLFSMIQLNIEDMYFQQIGIPGLSILPLLSGYLVERNPELVGKIAPIIANLFAPLALFVLIVFLSSVLFTGQNPYRDREFLLIFNLVLIAVMALILFSLIGAENKISRFEIWTLMGLSFVTILINGIALSAIGFRIAEWGFTPNRTAILGSNMLMLSHLILIFRSWVFVIRSKEPVSRVGRVISAYLPVYLIWAGVVSFLFPLIFGVRT